MFFVLALALLMFLFLFFLFPFFFLLSFSFSSSPYSSCWELSVDVKLHKTSTSVNP